MNEKQRRAAEGLEASVYRHVAGQIVFGALPQDEMLENLDLTKRAQVSFEERMSAIDRGEKRAFEMMEHDKEN